MSDRKHAKLAPSGASRWMTCQGSIQLCAGVPKRPSSSYADEGTAAHDLAAKCLLEKKAANTRIGTIINVKKNDREFTPFKVDDEMAEAVQVYLNAIHEDWTKHNKASMTIETRFNLSWLHNGMFGSNDCSIYAPEEKKLYVYDYKHGKGVTVEVEWNPQLLIYALGALYEAWDIEDLLITNSVKEIDIVIVQPRIDHPDGPVRRQTISTEDLMFWGMNVLKTAAKATEVEGAPLIAGKHCRWCDALAVCPKQIENACALAKVDFQPEPILPAPEDLSGDDIVRILDMAGIFNAWLEQIKGYVNSELMAGNHIPGYKLVAKRSNRAWKDEDDAERTLELLIGDEVYNKKLISVAQAEKIYKRRGLSAEANLDPLWEKPDAGVTTAPESDKRKEVPPPAAMEFLEGADFLE